MQFPKSTPDLDNPVNKRKARRQSNRHSKEFIAFEFKAANPFKQEESENQIPMQLQSQMDQMEYISTTSINKMSFGESGNRRCSNFQKNLQLMQQLAKRQEQKYDMMKRQQNGSHFKVVKIDNNFETRPLTLDEDEEISLQINGFYDYHERIDDDFNIFKNDMEEEQLPSFYSNNQLGCPDAMDEEVNCYFG